MVPWSNSAARSNGRGAGEPIQVKRVESLPDTNLIYFPGLLRLVLAPKWYNSNGYTL